MHHPFWLPLLIAAGLAAVTFWLGHLAKSPTPDLGGFGHDPDYIVESFDATAFDVQGRPRYRLKAEKMVHYMDDDTTTLDQPRFFREEVGAAPVHVQAKRGLISSDGQDVYLLDGVRMEQVGSGRGLSALLTTDMLQVTPEKRLMRTDQPVRLSQGASVMTARGMVADANKRQLLLTGGVKSTYENRP